MGPRMTKVMSGLSVIAWKACLRSDVSRHGFECSYTMSTLCITTFPVAVDGL